MMLLCLSASRIYDTFSISTRSRKKNQAIVLLYILSVHPDRSPGMMLLCLSASRIQLVQERLSEKMCTRQSRKVIWDLIYTLFLTQQLLNLLLLLSFSIRKHSSMASCAILSNFFEELRTQNRPQYLSGLSRALFSTTFLEIGLHFNPQPKKKKKKIGSCYISYLVHPGRSPGMMLLCLSASRIQLVQERLSEKMCTRQSRKVIWDLIYTLFLTQQLLNLLLLLSFSIRKHSSMASCAILSNFFEELRTQNRPQYLSGLSRALFSTTFLEIGLHNKFRISIRS